MPNCVSVIYEALNFAAFALCKNAVSHKRRPRFFILVFGSFWDSCFARVTMAICGLNRNDNELFQVRNLKKDYHAFSSARYLRMLRSSAGRCLPFG